MNSLCLQLLDLAPATQEPPPALHTEESLRGRTFLNCPFADKDEVKKLGARFDWEKKKWYVPQGEEKSPDVSLFARWLTL